MKKRVLLFFILLINFLLVSCVLSQTGGKTPSSVPKINLNPNEIIIFNSKIKNLPENHNFIGANWFYETEYNRLFLTDSKQTDFLAKAIQDYNIDIIRFPGGCNVGDFFWNQPNSDIFKSLANHYAKTNQIGAEKNYKLYLKPTDRMDLKTFLEFCKKYGFKTTIQVNTHKYFNPDTKEISFLKDYDFDAKGNRRFSAGLLNRENIKKAAQSASQEVKWVYDNNYQDVVSYWELGNEEWMNVQGQSKSVFYTGKEYAYVASVYIKEMKKANPDIKILLTAAAPPHPSKDITQVQKSTAEFFNKWVGELLSSDYFKGMQNDIFAVTHHTYPFEFGKKYDFESFKQDLLTHRGYNLSYKYGLLQKRLAENGFNHIYIFNNEFNSANYTSEFSHTWLNALGNAKIVIRNLNAPLAIHTDFHELLGFHGIQNNIYRGKSMALFHYAKDYDRPFLPYPNASVVLLLNQNINKAVLKTDANSNEIETASTINGNKISTIILNFSTPKKLTLKYKNFGEVKYVGNKVIGLNTAATFRPVDLNDDYFNPSEFRIINPMDNKLKVNRASGSAFTAEFPKNTLSVLTFQIIK